MTEESKVVLDAMGRATAFVGPDAIRYYQVAVIKSALGLLAKGITPRRGVTRKGLLAQATQITGKTYRVKDLQEARNDLQIWLNAMRSAIPVETQDGAPHA